MPVDPATIQPGKTYRFKSGLRRVICVWQVGGITKVTWESEKPIAWGKLEDFARHAIEEVIEK